MLPSICIHICHIHKNLSRHLNGSLRYFCQQEPRMSLRSAMLSASVKCPSPGDTNCQLQNWQGAFVTGSLASKTKTKVAPQSLAVSTAPHSMQTGRQRCSNKETGETGETT